MKAEMKGFNCWILSSNMDAFKFVGLRPERKVKMFNGDLECSFRKYSIYEGSKKGKYMNLDGQRISKHKFWKKSNNFNCNKKSC